MIAARPCLSVLFALWIAGVHANAQGTVNVVLQNDSSENLLIIRGNNPGKGNRDGVLRAGETREVKSVKGRVWSAMLEDRLVASHRTTGTNNQRFAVTDAMVREVFPGRSSGKGKSAPKGPKAANPGTGKGAQKASNSGRGGGAAIPSDTGSKVGAGDAAKFVGIHNDARRKVGVKPITWSPELAKWAQKQANRIARDGKFEHTQNAPYGENLGAGSGAYTVMSAAQGWNKEVQHYRQGEPARISGNRVTGHYTQMVWRQTTEVGAGIATIQTGPYRGWTVVVGAYNPRGNRNNLPPY